MGKNKLKKLSLAGRKKPVQIITDGNFSSKDRFIENKKHLSLVKANRNTIRYVE